MGDWELDDCDVSAGQFGQHCRYAAPMMAQHPKERFFELRQVPSARRTAILGIIGAVTFFGIWEIGHYLTPESGQRFLPSVEQVVGKLIFLFADKGFAYDVAVSCMRIFGSFFGASLIAVPLGIALGIAMGCFANFKALVNPTVSGWRYLPAASFIPLLLVWFGPTETAKMGLLFLGVVFFLVAMVLDNTEAVENALVEAALTMGPRAHASSSAWSFPPPRRPSSIPCGP
jgi:NitT/TauT family transport system permease protein